MYYCKFCNRNYIGKTRYIRHLEFHVKDLAKKLDIVIK